MPAPRGAPFSEMNRGVIRTSSMSRKLLQGANTRPVYAFATSISSPVMHRAVDQVASLADLKQQLERSWHS